MPFSRVFPSHHPRRGEPTYFVEKIWTSLNITVSYKMICDLNEGLPVEILWSFWQSIRQDYLNPKHHTIRAGNRWKGGDKFSPVVWALPGGRFTKGNKQIIIAPDIEVKNGWEVRIDLTDQYESMYLVNDNGDQEDIDYCIVAKNDGLTDQDFYDWFDTPKNRREIFKGQIICFNENINYLHEPTIN
jgi:hypothetical protein